MLHYYGKDNEASRYWAKKAYDNGSILGGGNLATMYRYGIGGETDLAKAISINIDVAKKGSIVAVHNLGEMYLSGDGVQKDKDKAIKYLRLACENGRVDSCSLLKIITS
ncbi:tetratricopeptide repeat protein [Serratia marcescens]|uniref:tetratricopeptide repeat protein n=1 Tax=Serratia marcescens TaxID=615 RepID=UPI0009408827|nr:tetratricopeptide repeat protein [Serratia marcescens]